MKPEELRKAVIEAVRMGRTPYNIACLISHIYEVERNKDIETLVEDYSSRNGLEEKEREELRNTLLERHGVRDMYEEGFNDCFELSKKRFRSFLASCEKQMVIYLDHRHIMSYCRAFSVGIKKDRKN